jgi:hypothetical protein
MPTSNGIPDEVRRFILAQIDSVPLIEALLLLCDRADEVWTDDKLGRALYVSPVIAKKIASDMLHRGWITVSSEADGYVYNSVWDCEGVFMKTLASVYRTQLVPVTQLIHSQSSSAARDFAKAFNLKKE